MSREPIGNTCPEINKYIKSIEFNIYNDRDLKNMDQDDLYNVASNMSYELSSCIDYLESLRTANAELRSWAEEEADEVDSLNAYIIELEEKLNDKN